MSNKPEKPPIKKPEPQYLFLSQIGKGFIHTTNPDGQHSAGKLYPMYNWDELLAPRAITVFKQKYPHDDVFKPGYASPEEGSK